MTLTFTPNGKPVKSWDDAAAQLTRPDEFGVSYIWVPHGQPLTITYAFRSTAPGSPVGDPGDQIGGINRFNSAQIDATEKILTYWSDVANITFQRVGAGNAGEAAYSNNATILFSNYTTGATGAGAFAFLPSPGTTGSGSSQGDVWINNALGYNAAPTPTNFGSATLVHEIGHALGLEHPSDYDAGQGQPSYDEDASYFQDTNVFTVMSYFREGIPGADLPRYPAAPQLHDIAAAQLLYGVNYTTRASDTVYGFNSNSNRDFMTIANGSAASVFAIWDGGGNDTLDLSGYSTNSEIDLRQEAFSSAGPDGIGGNATYNIAIAKGAVIENAIGGPGNDLILGNSTANTLTGNGGNDYLDGGAGGDTMIGGLGNDSFVIDDANDHVTENAGQGADRILTALATFNLGSAANVEELVYIGAGNFIGVGTSNNDIIRGASGNDYAYCYDGNDVAYGGAGVDVFVMGAGADTAVGGAGQDYFYMGDGNDVMQGDDGVDVFLGESGNDIAYGNNDGDYFYLGDGADTGYGGAGNDIFVMADGNDAAQGDDGQDYFYMGAGDDFMYGGPGVDVLLGEAGNDTFDAGSGVDYLFLGSGGAGDNDTIFLYGATSGVQVVNDFEAGGANDLVRLIGTSFANFSGVLAAFTDFTASGGFSVLSIDADTALWFIGLAPTQFTEQDFLYA